MWSVSGTLTGHGGEEASRPNFTRWPRSILGSNGHSFWKRVSLLKGCWVSRQGCSAAGSTEVLPLAYVQVWAVKKIPTKVENGKRNAGLTTSTKTKVILKFSTQDLGQENDQPLKSLSRTRPLKGHDIFPMDVLGPGEVLGKVDPRGTCSWRLPLLPMCKVGKGFLFLLQSATIFLIFFTWMQN